MIPISEGRIVHTTVQDKTGAMVTRPAIVVRVSDRETGLVNLQVFTDGENDFAQGRVGSSGLLWVTNCKYAEDAKPGFWQWPPKVKANTEAQKGAA